MTPLSQTEADSTAKRYLVAPLAEFPAGSQRIVPIGQFGVGVFNVNGELVAIVNRCPHMGGPLCLGTVGGTTFAEGPYVVEWIKEGEILRCPWHGWEFDLRSAATVTDPIRRVRTYPVYVEAGNIYVEA